MLAERKQFAELFFYNLQFVKRALNVIKEGLLCTFCVDSMQ